jgi:hypothetical protein
MSTINYICQIDIDNKLLIQEFEDFNPIITKFPELKTVKLGVQACLRGARPLYNNFGWIYKSELDKIGIENFVAGKITKKLFIHAFPELVKELNAELNKGVDIEKLTHGSNTKLYWDCKVNPSHPTYDSFLYNRTRSNDFTGCPECKNTYIGILNTQRKEKRLQNPVEKKVPTKEEKAEHIKNYIQKIDNTIIGDETENYITKLLTDTGLFFNVDTIGHSGDHSDVIVTLNDGIIKSLQVKTLIATNRDDVYCVGFSQKYDKDMLVVMVNKARDRFALQFAGNIKVTNLNLSYSAKKSKYKDIMYTDKNIFLNKLIELIPQSVSYDGFSADPTTTKEHKSLLRLESWCPDHNLKYRGKTNNGTSVDCYINEIPIQAKYRSFNKIGSNNYQISTVRCKGTLNNKSIKGPYSIDDPFEYIVAEIGGTKDNPTKYIGYFCFIPKWALIKQGILATATSPGKRSMYICPPDYHDPTHWSYNFWYNKDSKVILERYTP